MGDITSSFSFAHSTTNYIVKSLESKDLVNITTAEIDNRVRIVNLTEKGNSLLLLLLNHLEKVSLKILSDILPILFDSISDEITIEEKNISDKLLNKVNLSIKNTID